MEIMKSHPERSLRGGLIAKKGSKSCNYAKATSDPRLRWLLMKSTTQLALVRQSIVINTRWVSHGIRAHARFYMQEEAKEANG